LARVKRFTRSARRRWGGLPALSAPNDVLVLFTEVATAPPTSPQTAIWHFGWHVTDTRETMESYRGLADVALLPLYTGDGGGEVFISSDTWPGTGGVLGLTKAQIAEASAVQPTRSGGFGYMRAPTTPWWSTRETIRPSASTTCTSSRRTRSALSSGTRSTSMRSGIGLLGRPASESGRLRQGDGGHGWGARGRRVVVLPILFVVTCCASVSASVWIRSTGRRYRKTWRAAASARSMSAVLISRWVTARIVRVPSAPMRTP
jgi:hypothetical protein